MPGWMVSLKYLEKTALGCFYLKWLFLLAWVGLLAIVCQCSGLISFSVFVFLLCNFMQRLE